METELTEYPLPTANERDKTFSLPCDHRLEHDDNKDVIHTNRECQNHPPSDIFVTTHPPQLLPHVQLIPFLRPPLDLPIRKLKNRRGRPIRLSPARLNAVVRLSAVTSASTISEQNHVVLCKDVVVRLDAEVGDGGHHLGV